MKKILTCLLTVLGLNTACGQGNFENADVNEFAELVADTNVMPLAAASSLCRHGDRHLGMGACFSLKVWKFRKIIVYLQRDSK